ncbi:MAG: putative metal-binding motif-containing protein [Kofleriaceae bacterium]
MLPLARIGAACLGLALLGGPARAEDCAETGVGELGAGLIEHSCFHTTHGPFARVDATIGATAGPATPKIDAVHTDYAVGIDPAQINVVTYAPLRSGTWAIFGDLDVPHELVDELGAVVPVRLTHDVPGCPVLPRVRVFSLSAFERYTLRLGPAPAGSTTTHVVVEKVGDFEAQYGRDLDGDGFGGDDEVVSTPCVPPPGYVRNVSDCDDADPAVHPEADERCNGVDDNCNGIADEEACMVSGGGCDGGGAPGHALFVVVPALLVLICAARRRAAR